MNTARAATADSLAAMPVTVIMNAGSGHDDKDSSRDQIEQELTTAGRDHRIEVAASGEIDTLVRRIVDDAKANPRIVVAAGGDGTINTVAGTIAGTGVPFGVIPLGTFNFFARDLGMPLDPTEATKALLDAHTETRHMAKVNERAFLINASVGLYRKIQEEREQFKQRFGRNKLMAGISGLRTLLKEHRSYDVQLEVDGKPLRLRTPMIFFGFNALQLEKLDLPVAKCPPQGLLAMLVLRPMSRFELLSFAVRGTLKGLGDAENLNYYCASRVDVQLRNARHVKVAVDGESFECQLPLRFEVMHDALNVVVPNNPAPRE